MTEFVISSGTPNKYTDAELDAMCLYSENIELKRRVQILEDENVKLKADLIQISTQMEGMIYDP